MEESSGKSLIIRVVGFGTILAPIVGYEFRGFTGVWPPIGQSVQFFGAAIVSAVIALVGRVAKKSFRTKTSAIRAAIICSALSLLAVVAYGCLFLMYVRNVTDQVTGETVYVSVGTQYTSEVTRLQALGKFPTPVTDEDILKIAGVQDENIKKMWMPSSVFRVRAALLISYVLLLSSINFITGALARVGD